MTSPGGRPENRPWRSIKQNRIPDKASTVSQRFLGERALDCLKKIYKFLTECLREIANLAKLLLMRQDQSTSLGVKACTRCFWKRSSSVLNL